MSLALASDWNPNEGLLADQVLAADGKAEWITARRLSQELLLEQPESYIGHHVLGRAFWLGEGDYARASYHLTKSLDIYQQRYQSTDDPPWRLESEGWWSLRIVSGDMGEFEEELRLIDVYNTKQQEYEVRFGSSYNPLMAERGWPLMKLGRYDEAKYWGQIGIDSESSWQTSLGWNVLCATSGEEGLRQGAADACFAALDHGLDSGMGIAVDASNAANASLAILDFEQVENFARLATRSTDGTTVSAWINLIHLYMAQGRSEAAIDAVEGSLLSLASEEPAMRLQKRADVDGAFALLLLVGGEEQNAFEKIDRALKYPDRRGVISTSEAQSRGSHTLLRYVARKIIQQRMKEKVASQGFWARIRHWWATWFGDPVIEVDAQSIRTVLQEETHLVSTIRPYLDKGLTGVPYWLLGHLIEIVGAGVIESSISDARSQDTFPGTEGYYHYLESHIAFDRKDWQKVIELASQARNELPMIEQLMRAVLLVLEGVAHEKSGDSVTRVSRFESAMDIDPSIFRRLNIAIPTRFPIESGLSGSVVDALQRSPRFKSSNEGFSLNVSDGRICLLGSLGQQFTCTSFPEREDTINDSEYVTQITELFHVQAFSLNTGMSTADWNSLDGRATSSKQRSRDRMKKLLDSEK